MSIHSLAAVKDQHIRLPTDQGLDGLLNAVKSLKVKNGKGLGPEVKIYYEKKQGLYLSTKSHNLIANKLSLWQNSPKGKDAKNVLLDFFNTQGRAMRLSPDRRAALKQLVDDIFDPKVNVPAQTKLEAAVVRAKDM